MRKPILPVRTLDDQLIRDEGWENKAYPDPLTFDDPWTIGVGHTGPEVHQGLEWDDIQVQVAFNEDILRHNRELVRKIPWCVELDHIRFCALLNMAFNMGIPKLSKFKKLLAALNAQDWPKAYSEALDSKWATQVGPRAQRLAKQFRDGIWY